MEPVEKEVYKDFLRAKIALLKARTSASEGRAQTLAAQAAITPADRQTAIMEQREADAGFARCHGYEFSD